MPTLLKLARFAKLKCTTNLLNERLTELKLI